MKAPTQSAPVERNEINRKVTERAGGSNSVTQSQQCGCPNLASALAHLDIVGRLRLDDSRTKITFLKRYRWPEQGQRIPSRSKTGTRA